MATDSVSDRVEEARQRAGGAVASSQREAQAMAAAAGTSIQSFGSGVLSGATGGLLGSGSGSAGDPEGPTLLGTLNTLAISGGVIFTAIAVIAIIFAAVYFGGPLVTAATNLAGR